MLLRSSIRRDLYVSSQAHSTVAQMQLTKKEKRYGTDKENC
jgi:hypothetical protein